MDTNAIKLANQTTAASANANPYQGLVADIGDHFPLAITKHHPKDNNHSAAAIERAIIAKRQPVLWRQH